MNICRNILVIRIGFSRPKTQLDSFNLNQDQSTVQCWLNFNFFSLTVIIFANFQLDLTNFWIDLFHTIEITLKRTNNASLARDILVQFQDASKHTEEIAGSRQHFVFSDVMGALVDFLARSQLPDDVKELMAVFLENLMSKKPKP